MVVCKYFQQGNCRFGQYCRFEHTTGFGVSQNAGNKAYGDNKSIVLSVAEEALAAERGGQWLLSCFGPFKEQACIPGMDDISPEEVRWEMYQAKKNNTVEETNLQFQQLCQIMTAKRDALKNPTQETVAMLEKLQKPQRDSNFASKPNSTVFNSQLGSSTVGSGIFGAPTTASFGQGFSNTAPNTQLSIFSRTTPTTSSVFGGKPSFGAFEAQKPSNSIFGGSSTKTITGFGVAASASPFSSTVSTVTATETTVTQQNNALSSFSAAGNDQNSIFSANQATSVFGDKAIANSPFANPHNQQSAVSSFNNGQQAPSLFGNAASIQSHQSGGSIFGGGTTNLAAGGTSIFGQAKTNPPPPPPFGGTSIFPGSGGNQVPLGFAARPGNVFGDANAFSNDGSIFASNNYAGTANPSQNTFAGAQNLIQYGNPVPLTSEENSVGSAMSTTSMAGFGKVVPVMLGNISESATSNSNNSNNSVQNNAVANSGAPVINNPFIPRSQETVNPFQGQGFSQSLLPRTNNSAVDQSLYSADKDLSENEKTMFRAEFFTLAKIPINPPTIELR